MRAVNDLRLFDIVVYSVFYLKYIKIYFLIFYINILKPLKNTQKKNQFNHIIKVTGILNISIDMVAGLFIGTKDCTSTLLP